jgi:hypothetical protein
MGSGYAIPRPPPWIEFRGNKPPWLSGLLYIEWLGRWVAYALNRWSVLAILDHAGRFSVLIAVIFYFADADNRTKQRHYQAWQVINTAQDKGGAGGRIDALQELNADGVPLVGVDVDDAFLEDMHLPNAELRRSSMHSADLKGADLSGSNLEESNLKSANLRDSRLRSANLNNVNLTDSDLTNADLTGSRVDGLNLDNADLTGANLSGIANWQSIDGIQGATIDGLQNPPIGFLPWAIAHGATPPGTAAPTQPASRPDTRPSAAL